MKICFEFDNHGYFIQICIKFEYVDIFKLGISLAGIAWATENGENCGHFFYSTAVFYDLDVMWFKWSGHVKGGMLYMRGII